MTGAARVGSSVPRLRRAYAACSRPSATGNGAPAPCCTDKALDEAMEVFWRHGYDGASLAMPTRAMGIEAPSLYAAFGSKEGLLRAALDRYAQRRSEHMRFATSRARVTAAVALDAP